MLRWIWLAAQLFLPLLLAQTGRPAVISGNLVQWQPITLSFDGPEADATDVAPNPFLDYRLQVSFSSPSGREFEAPGFFAGDGAGGARGQVWQVRVALDEPGEWTYSASFRRGLDVAVSLDPQAGEPAYFNGAHGIFTVGPRDAAAPGFLKWGRLAYAGGHYLRFADGPFFLKGGSNSPENFLAYAGFANTQDGGGLVPNFLHRYAAHVADWRAGDPTFEGALGDQGRGIIGALNYVGTQGVNALYMMPLNLGGDGWDVAPFLKTSGSHIDNTHYDVTKLHQWNVVLEHAQRQGIMIHMVLGETEAANEQWLDGGSWREERRLFYREMVARFGYLLALQWNLSEENNFPLDQVRVMTDYLRALDWADHPVTLHNQPNDFRQFDGLLGDPRYTVTSLQFEPDQGATLAEEWRARSARAGQPWVIGLDEMQQLGALNANADELRKRVLYPVYFSGGNLEWFAGFAELPVGGDVTLENFRTRERVWQATATARRFMEENLPFWVMEPADALLQGASPAYGGGQVLAWPGQVYAVYLPEARGAPELDLSGATGVFRLRWFNPRSGVFEGEATTVTGGAVVALGTPPAEAGADWVTLVRAVDLALPPPPAWPTTPAPYGAPAAPTREAPASPTPSPTPVVGAAASATAPYPAAAATPARLLTAPPATRRVEVAASPTTKAGSGGGWGWVAAVSGGLAAGYGLGRLATRRTGGQR